MGYAGTVHEVAGMIFTHGPTFKYQDMLSATVQSNSRPPKPLTHAFDPHMSVFVDAQDRYVSPSHVY